MTSAPTEEQRLILEHQEARIRLVRAVPGSGKTWLVARKMADALAKWRHRHRGIAALSFTNVARNEIHRALGFLPSHPHFVGTLDAFIFRYIVRPFGFLFDSALAHPVLVPGEYAQALAEKQQWLPTHPLQVQIGDDRSARASLFTTTFLEEIGGHPVFLARPSRWESKRLEGSDADRMLRAKQKVWLSSGRVSHSDTAYLALRVLRGQHGGSVLETLERRFPVLIVDELQDTGWYMGHVLREILCRTNCKALLVGDPDQAIFEFGGASPALFDSFLEIPECKLLPMELSRRCPERTRVVAQQLRSTEGRIGGRDDPGRAILAVYDQNGVEALSGLCDRLSRKKQSFNLIVRRNSDIELLRPNQRTSASSFRSRPLENLYRAVVQLREGSPKRAIALADMALSRTVFGAEHVDEAMLRERGIRPFDWRKVLVGLLLEGLRSVEGESLYDWCLRLRASIERLLSKRRWTATRIPRRPPKQLRTQPAWPRGSNPADAPHNCTTVHGAKGQTHETTVYFLTERRSDHCPSVHWWQPDSEERRIAFVAATRATDTFILCIERSVFSRLQERRPEFVASFQVSELSEVDI